MTLADALRIVECRPGERPRDLSPGGRSDESAVLWVDVDLRALGDRDPATAAGELGSVLADICPDVDEEMLEDLLDADLWPKRQRYGHIRAVSAVSVVATDPPADQDETRAGSLTFQVVEMLSSNGWLVTCWHAPRTFRGLEQEPVTGELEDHADMVGEIEEEWASGKGRAAGDLGLIVLEQLVDTYTDVRNALSDWLDNWELDLYRRVETDSQPDRRTLIELRAHVFQFRKSIATLNAPSGKAKTYWFTDVSDENEAERIDDRIDRALRTVNELSDRLRSALDLVQLQLAQVQGKRTERLQQKFELITSILLVPTLIAGAYGANTKFPGLNEAWGTVTMLSLMVLGGTLTFLGLRRLRRREVEALEREGDEAAERARGAGS